MASEGRGSDRHAAAALQETMEEPCSRAFRLKLCHNESIRLVMVTLQLSMQALVEAIKKTFSELKSASGIVISYGDSEGETITVETDEDLNLALGDMSASQAVPRFSVREKAMATGLAPAKPSSQAGPCKFFQSGYCRNGSRCKFSHSSNNSSTGSTSIVRPVLLSAWSIERWLENLIGRSPADNIEELSSPPGLEMLCKVASSLQLTRKAADMLAKLLTRDEMRSSMLRHETNKIYGSLADSRYAMQLQAHMTNQMPRTDEGLKPYLLLIEELQLRTSDGWKYLPLDAAEKLIAELPETPLRDELGERLGGPVFRKIPIIPSKDELLSVIPTAVPVNKVGLRYTSVLEYLETHFRLLREDFINPLRQGIKQYINRQGGYFAEVRIYSNVELKGVRFTLNGIENKVSFVAEKVRNKTREINWEQSKRLMFGSLLCMSRDNFQTITWATVAGRKELAQNMVDLRLLDGSDLDASFKYVMVESAAAYFEAYSHVLKSLQREDMENIPFKSHLISLVKHVKEPAYLPQRAEGDRYDFSSAFPGGTKEFGQFKFHILQDWPEWNSTLDSSQVAALKHALTKNLALIQGPPGTGKTFVGMLIVKLLLANLKREATKTRHFSTAEDVPDLCGPVLIVCYTNHALDQFLEGIFRSEKNVIRIGGRSKNKQLDGRNLQNLLQLARENRDVQGAYVRKAVAARDDRRRLEAEIRRCVDELNLPYVTETLLHGVATEDQITNLFYLGRTSALAGKKVVEAWLEAENLRYVDVPARRVEQVANRYAVLDDEVEAADLHDQTVNVPREEGRRTQGLAAPGDGGWVHVQTRRRNRPVEAVEQQQDPVVNNAHRDEVPLELLVDYPDVWSLPLRERKRLHEYWLDEIHANAQKELTRFKQEYEAACIECKAADSEIQLSLLRRAKVIGMTTTAAARLHDILVALKPEIVVVEEAAEVLESHILACISPYTKHLILIGDHLQLRPSVATFRLAQRHKLDVSMFERLVQSGVEHTMLKTQRRMKPCIAKLISSIYPQLRNHPSVLEYEDVKGVKSSLFFLDHNAPEEAGHEAGSKVNLAEAKLVVELCSYLLKQEAYAPGDMTILTMYKGQVQEISRRLKDRFQCRRVTGRPLGPEAENSEATDSWMPRVSSVDDFQGEENDIILLSLVRSNLVPGKEDEGTIGFLKTGNRVCVALSRARKGLYIFGNAQLLALKSPLWKGILHGLHQDGLMGSKLVLCCQNHPGVETSVQHAEDFLQVGDGGCSRPCEYQLECGHACPRRCHPESHDTFICPKMCLKPYDGCTHRCVKSCHGREDPACPPCKEPVLKTFPTCGHEQSVPCSTDPAKLTCRSPCKKLLSCGHACPEPCGLPCAKLCRQVVRKELPCGHATKMMCPQDPWTFSCLEPCRDILPDCEHRCGGTCDAPPSVEHHASSASSLVPGTAGTSAARFSAARSARDHAVTGHARSGSSAVIPASACVESLAQLTLEESESSDRFVELLDCGHIFEVTGLDQWMDMDDSAETCSKAIVLKFCPACKTPVRKSFRYANVVKKKLHQIELVKMKVYGHEQTRAGMGMLSRKEYRQAFQIFTEVIKNQPGNFEAHLGMAQALRGLKEFGYAVTHLRFIAERSSLAADIRSLPVPRLKRPYTPVPSSLNLSFVAVPSRSLTIQALIQWGSALTSLTEFSDAVRLCEIVLKHDSTNGSGKRLKEMAEKRLTHQVVEAVSAEFSARGHWYQCPNGHVYVVGECGGPMQTSHCPDCGSIIGGEHHQSAAGNTHSTIDGSDHALYSDHTEPY
ncbi:hypothetical protein SELMODRAFT_408664 [Selaginella moellendorffii]|uniref:Uncharacterized protein n=1 Tax=Selaginella moellendorffii TaxID=88036 RepID=D8R9J3_SELML|nr:hypothetical protein SELMODRAFT_408664 [Selaginella moellendorffii]